jgi:hypothetical protein
VERKSDNWPLFVRVLLSPTRALFDSRILRMVGWLDIKGWSVLFLLVNLGLLFLLRPFHTLYDTAYAVPVALVLYCVTWSRVVEIFYAFYYDAAEKLDEHGTQRTKLTKVDRLKLVALSYCETAVCFAVLYRSLPPTWFSLPATWAYRCPRIAEPFEWLYFSWITITTTGYGDIAPKGLVAKALSMLEIGLGLMLIVFAVGAYFAYRADPE